MKHSNPSRVASTLLAHTERWVLQGRRGRVLFVAVGGGVDQPSHPVKAIGAVHRRRVRRVSAAAHGAGPGELV